MSKTLTLKPQLQNVAEWVKIFPQQMTETYTSSVTFMKQLTVVAISTITYLKNLFPEDSFTTEFFGGVRLQILKKNCEHELAQFISSSIMQAFEAFDKKYLHQLAICFYDEECDERNLIEYHIFEYSYHSDGMSMNIQSKTKNNVELSAKYSFDNVRERTIQMIRACVVLMETCREETPRNYDVTLRLYYNKDAPAGYQAPGFLQPEEDRDHLRSTRHNTIKLGCVETPFHSLTPRSYIKDNNLSNEPAVNSYDDLTPVSITEDDFNVSNQKSPLSPLENRIQCPCNKFDTDDVLLTCQVCHTQQHAACFGIKRLTAAHLRQHCCAACSDANPRVLPTDAYLVSLSAKRRECVCLLRRTLSWCARGESLVPRQLMERYALPPLYVAKLLNILHGHGVVRRGPHSDLMAPHQVNVEQLKRVTDMFFPQQEQSQNSHIRLVPSSSSNRSESSIPEPSTPMEESSSSTVIIPAIPEKSPKQNNRNEEPRDLVISKVCSLPADKGYNVSHEEIANRPEKRKLSRRPEVGNVGIKAKRARANSN